METGVARVTAHVVFVYVVDYKRGGALALSNVILGTGTKTEFIFPPLDRDAGFGELTLQSHALALISSLVFQLFCKSDWAN